MPRALIEPTQDELRAAYACSDLMECGVTFDHAAAQANAAGVGLWLTPRGKHVLAPEGRPGWRRLNIRTQEQAPCAA